MHMMERNMIHRFWSRGARFRWHRCCPAAAFRSVMATQWRVCALLAFALPSVLSGQTSTGSVLGTVADPSGSVIPGAEITLESVTTGETRTASTDERGYYEFPLVLPGTYSVTAGATAFTTGVIDNIVVRVGQPRQANVTLQVGQVTEQITVEASAQQVNATDASLGNIVDQNEALVLPIRGRSFLEFATLSAGAVSKYPGSWSSIFSGGRESHAGIAISGSKDVSTIYLIDGVPSKSPEYGQVGYLLPLEAVHEFNTQRGFFSSRYPGPGVINIASVSGSNDFHGTLWHTVRNNVFDARNFFDVGEKPPLRQNQFGARAGGRIIKDRLFWMANFQVLRERRAQTLNGTAPTQLERSGDFSQSRTVLQGQPAGVVIVDPFTKDPLPQNTIPQSRFDAFAQGYMEFIPPAINQGVPFGQVNRVVAGRQIQDDESYDFKGDYVHSEATRLYVRYSFGESAKIFPSIEENYARSAPYDNRNGVIGYTRVINPNVLLEFHFGYDRVDNRPTQAVGPGIGERDFHTELGLVNVNQFQPCKQPPWVNLTFARYTSSNCVITLSNNYSYSTNLAWVAGKHSLNFGGQFTRVQVTNPIFNAIAGSFRFTGQYSGNPFADYLLGHPFQATGLTLPVVPYRRAWQYGLYIDDKYRATSNLTLNFGLRWEVPTPPHDKYDKLQAFRPANKSFAPNTPYEILLANQNGVSRKIVRVNWANFAPRFGFAWKPRGSEKWAARGSFGIFYETLIFNEYTFMSLGYPIVTPIEEVSDATIPTVRTSGQFVLGGEARLGGFQLSIDPDRRDPYIGQWTMSIERELPGEFLISTAYVGSTGVSLFKRLNWNVARPGPEPVGQRLPFPDFGGFIQTSAEGHSTYHGWQTDLNRRFSGGVSFRLGYTWSRSMDNGTSQGESYVPWDTRRDKSRTGFDVRHRLVLSGVFELPFGRGRRYGSSVTGIADKLISGWQIVPIATLQSGYPLSVRSIDRSNTGLQFGPRADRVGHGILPAGERTRERWFDTSAFREPAVNTLGNSGIRFMDAPGLHNWDLSLLKNTAITERVNLQIRVEFFNGFNHPAFGSPNTNISTPTAGQIFGLTRDGRELQFVTRLRW